MAERVRVAIVGGGPAGLAAALALRRRGVAAVVLEREAEAGGIPRQCGHPPYGLREFGRLLAGPAYARRLRESVRAAGIEVRLRQSVVALGPGGLLDLATPEGRRSLAADRVLLATGARETPRSARLISGDRPPGVMNTATLQDCVYLRSLRPFARPVVVGSELVALSALWTCVRHGIRPAALIEAEPRATARWPLGLFPRLLGIPVHYRAEVAEILGSGAVEAVRIAGPDGDRRIACDGVILTGRFLPEASLLHGSPLRLDPGTGGPSIDQDGRCSDPAYFAAGNLLRPIETAGWCFREGQRIAAAIADDLAGACPAAEPIELVAGAGVRWLAPQRLTRNADVALRADAPIRGRLVVRAGERLVWSRRIATRPERRLRVPSAALALRPRERTVTIAIERD